MKLDQLVDEEQYLRKEQKELLEKPETTEDENRINWWGGNKGWGRKGNSRGRSRTVKRSILQKISAPMSRRMSQIVM